MSTIYDDLLKPEHFDWAEDVEESLGKMSQGQLPPCTDILRPECCDFQDMSQSQSASGDDLLYPMSMDCAEEVEEDILNKPQAYLSASISPVKNSDDIISHDYCQDEIYPHSGSSTQRDSTTNNHRCLDSIEENDEYESGDEFDPLYNEEEFDILTPATSQSLSYSTEVNPRAIQNFQLTLGEVEHEFAWRQYDTYMDPEIHHYNFMGQPVYRASATSPSDSLAVIMSGPKVPEAQESLRVQSILRRANMFVDPVILNLYGIDESILLQRGSALRRAATGRVSTFYSPHGTWMGDNSEQTAFNVCDTGDVDTYVSNDVAVGNGFIRRGCIASREDWLRMRDERMSPMGRGRLARKMTWSPKASPLCQSKTIVPEPVRSQPAVEELQHHVDLQQSGSSSSLGNQIEPAVFEPASGELQPATDRHYLTTDSRYQPNSVFATSKPKQKGKFKRKKRQQSRQFLKNSDASPDPGSYFSFPEPSFSTDRSFSTDIKKCLCRCLEHVWCLITGSFTTRARLPDDGNKVFSL